MVSEPVPYFGLPTDWRASLPLLEGHGLALLPIGAKAPERKAPVDPTTGYGLKDWQHSTGYAAADIAAMNPVHVIACGVNTGHGGILVLDIDGASAADWCQQHGADPATAATWHITRNTDPTRYKLVFRLTPEQQAQFPQTKLLLRTTSGEALEIYWQPGAQVLVLGEHCKSGGRYEWVNTPADIAAPTGDWMCVFMAIRAQVEELRGKGDLSRPPKVPGVGGGGKWLASGPSKPCPICGRTRSAACTWSYAAERTIATCYHGSGDLLCPQGLKPGEVITGHGGNRWAFVRTYIADCLGEKSLFVDHQPRSHTSPPPPMPAPTNALNSASPQAAGGPQPPVMPTPDQPAIAQLSTMLKAEMKDGLSGARLAERSTELAAQFGVFTSEVNTVIKELQGELDGEAQAGADAIAITAERRAAELRKLFTLDYLFPPEIAEPLKLVQSNLRHDDLVTAMIYLTSLSGVLKLGTKIAADLYGFHQPPMMWLALVGDSGKGKTQAVDHFATFPLSLVKKEYRIVNDRRMGEWDLTCSSIPKGQARPKPPAKVFAAVERFTFAALQIALEAHQHEHLGMLVKVQELAGLFQGLNQFSQGGKGDEQQQMLTLFDGSGEPTLRVQGGERVATQWQVSIVGGIQGDVFNTYIKHGDPDGLFARLLLLPITKRPLGEFADKTLDEVQAAHRATEKIADFIAQAHRLPPTTYTFSLAARKERHRLQVQTDELVERELIKANQNVYGKRLGYIVRLAGILHICNIVAGRAMVDEEIPLATVSKAREVIDFLQSYACEAHIRAQQSDDVTIDDMLRRIHVACLDNPMGAGRFRADHLSRKQRQSYSTAAITSYMEQLVSLDCGTWLDGGGRARSFLSLNRLT